MKIFRKASSLKAKTVTKKDVLSLEEKTTTSRNFYQKSWFKISMLVILILLLAGGALVFKTGYILNKISSSDSSGLKSILNILPIVGKNEDIKGESEGRINLLLLGMRGADVPGGGLLADTIIVVSIKPAENKVAMISIPRDLYVIIPGTNQRAKINAVHAYGEDQGKHKGLEMMKKITGEVTGLPIHYAVSINFTGFKQLIDAVGGIDVYLETPFYETSQFVEGKECGIEFTLPAGNNHLDGETALCYARARENTSDFDRAKRQQVILKALKDKLVSLGTLTDFGKLNAILNAIGDNVRTDMKSHEMKKFYEKYAGLQNAQIYQRVFENSEEGMLMVPSDAPEGAGYVLIPRAGWDNYSQIHSVCQNIFSLPPQSDIQPVKQYSRPKTKTSNEAEKNKKSKKR
jgi:LCP family protein required for cell wall assembly